MEHASLVVLLLVSVQRGAKTEIWAISCVLLLNVAGSGFWRKHHEDDLEIETSDLQQTITRRLVYLKPNEDTAHTLSRLLATCATSKTHKQLWYLKHPDHKGGVFRSAEVSKMM